MPLIMEKRVFSLLAMHLSTNLTRLQVRRYCYDCRVLRESNQRYSIDGGRECRHRDARVAVQLGGFPVARGSVRRLVGDRDGAAIAQG
jgi:hypothetical protein